MSVIASIGIVSNILATKNGVTGVVGTRVTIVTVEGLTRSAESKLIAGLETVANVVIRTQTACGLEIKVALIADTITGVAH